MKKLVGLMAVTIALLALIGPLSTDAVRIPRMYIDRPVNGTTITANLNNTVSGWALNAYGIREVDVRIDGGTYSRASYGAYRPDVNNAFPGYPSGSYSGFSYNIAAGSLRDGTHTITVKAIGKNGSYQINSVTVRAQTLNPRMYLDAPGDNQTFSVGSAITFSGWALNATGIRNVDVTIDGTKASAATQFYRPDVDRAFPGYPGGVGSGFSYTLPANSLGAGTHTVTVTAIGNNGSSQQITRAFTTVIPSPAAFIDTPADGSTWGDNRDITVSGWAVNWSGIKQVNIYLDGSASPVASTQTNQPRSDVARVFPGYPGTENAGYSVTLPIASLTSGPHKVKEVATGNNGTISTSERSFTVQKYQMGFDTGTLPQYLNTSIGFTGWAINAAVVKSVTLYIDGNPAADAQIGQPRSDIPSLYPAYPGTDTSGYTFSGVDVTNLSTGKHTLRVDTVGNDNTVQSQSFTATKQAPVTVIEQPANNISTGGTVTVSGFSLNATGIAGVSASVDGSQPIPATIVDNPNPVGKYAGYKNPGNSGFTVDIDISALTTGKHTVTITGTGIDGGTSSTSVTIYNRGVITNTSYSYTLSSMMTSQLNSSPGPGYSYSGWKYIRNALNGYYYFKGNADGSTTYTWVPEASPYTVYNTIYNQFAYYVNPSNLINNNVDIYQFMKLSYVDGVSAAGLNSFFNPNGVLNGMGQAFIDAGKKYNVNPIYLAMHAIEETGNGTSTLARGMTVSAGTYNIAGTNYTVSQTGVYYNLFGIRADDGAANLHGSEYAGYKGWDTVQKAIEGGAYWIAYNYINTYNITGTGYNQDTLYKMRWNPNRPGTYQYATDILWAHNSAAYIKQYYDRYTSMALTFDVPSFLN